MQVQPFLPYICHTENRMRTSEKSQEPVSTRRFISGIKGPLALQLTPRSLADVESSLPFNRSTFGSSKFQKRSREFSEDRYSTRQGSKYTRLPLPIRSQYRDTPIYRKPQLGNFPISPPSSCGDTVDDGSSINTEIDDNCETMANLPLFCQGDPKLISCRVRRMQAR